MDHTPVKFHLIIENTNVHIDAIASLKQDDG